MRAANKCVVVFVLLGLCSVSQAEPKPAKATAADGFRVHELKSAWE